LVFNLAIAGEKEVGGKMIRRRKDGFALLGFGNETIFGFDGMEGSVGAFSDSMYD
jgi:hypothetical protein